MVRHLAFHSKPVGKSRISASDLMSYQRSSLDKPKKMARTYTVCVEGDAPKSGPVETEPTVRVATALTCLTCC